MKFCTKKTYNYVGLNNVETSVDFILYEDVLTFHGKIFAEQWLVFIKNKPTFNQEDKICYYYYDYKHAARQTDSFLNPVG